MSTVRKYAGLPDLDPAPDIYETPELTDDASTHPTSTTYRSESPPYQDDEDNSIDRHRIDPDEARTHFLPAAERDPSLASRINSKRKSYRSSSRKRRKDGTELNGLINGLEFSSDDEEENLERRLARLCREVAEVKEQCSQNGEQKRGLAAPETKDASESLDTLSKVLDSVAPPSAVNEIGAATRLVQKLGSTRTSKEPLANGTGFDKLQQNGENSIYTISYAPKYDEDHALSKISDFDSRLTLLESALGLETIPLPTQEQGEAKAVLPSLNKLDKQLTALTVSSDSSLDTFSRKVRQLTQDAEKLEQARKAAKAAHEALRQKALSASSNNAQPDLLGEASKVPDIEDPESISKINALYGTLSTIESLAPILPSVLDRLRSLRSLHADAATASQTLTNVESRQEEMQQELQGWREGLGKVEKAMEQGEKTTKSNTEMVDDWVKDLEERMRKMCK